MLTPLHIDLHEEAPAIVERAPPAAFFRLGAGLAEHAPSSHGEQLLEAEGYDEKRAHIAFDGAYVLSRPFAIGGFVQYAFRGSRPDTGGPEMSESTWITGVQAPIVFFTWHERVAFTIAPRFGVAESTISLYGKGDGRWGVAYGGEVGLFFVSRTGVGVGLGIGYLRAPMNAPGALGGRYDAGGLTFNLSVVLDV